MQPAVPTPRSNYAGKLQAFPGIAFAEEQAFLHRGRWQAFFRERIGAAFNGRIIFEIGCFNAAYLCRIAANHPDTAFIGLDWKYKAIYDGASQIAEEKLRNIALLRGRGQDLLQMCGDAELDELWLLHPDPCDKPIELRNRLMGEPFLIDAHRVLRDDDSRLVLKTDHPGYYQWTLSLFGLPQPWWFADQTQPHPPRTRFRDLMPTAALPLRSDAAVNLFSVGVHSNDLWNDAVAKRALTDRLFAHEKTAFETRFVTKRQPIYYLEFLRRKVDRIS